MCYTTFAVKEKKSFHYPSTHDKSDYFEVFFVMQHDNTYGPLASKQSTIRTSTKRTMNHVTIRRVEKHKVVFHLSSFAYTNPPKQAFTSLESRLAGDFFPRPSQPYASQGWPAFLLSFHAGEKKERESASMERFFPSFVLCPLISSLFNLHGWVFMLVLPDVSFRLAEKSESVLEDVGFW